MIEDQETVEKADIAPGFSPCNIDGIDIALPPKAIRSGGVRFRSNGYFFQFAVKEAEWLIEKFNLNRESTVLDVGCGVAKLAIGILHTLGTVKRYIGVDVRPLVIDWAKHYIEHEHPHFNFIHLDVHNSRYNRETELGLDEMLPLSTVADGEVDVVYMCSVFSHMLAYDVRAYLAECKRVLKPTGVIFTTVFVEDDIEGNVLINPSNRYGGEWGGSLHCVLYRQGFFEDLLNEYGFKVDSISVDMKRCGYQKMYHLKKVG